MRLFGVKVLAQPAQACAELGWGAASALPRLCALQGQGGEFFGLPVGEGAGLVENDPGVCLGNRTRLDRLEDFPLGGRQVRSIVQEARGCSFREGTSCGHLTDGKRMGLLPAKPYRLVLVPSGRFFIDRFLNPGQRAQFHGCRPSDEPVCGFHRTQCLVGREEGGERKAQGAGHQ